MSSFSNYGDSRFLIGGASVPEGLLLNDIWYLDLTAVDFSGNQDLGGAKWTMLDFDEGKEVPFLKGHASCAIDEENVIIFGGFDQNLIPRNETFHVSFEDFECKLVEVKGNYPLARGHHQMIKIRKPYIALYGGCVFENDKKAMKLNDMFIYDYTNYFWTKICPGGYIPMAITRSGMSYSQFDK